MSRLSQAKPAVRQGTKARIALEGPTGSGKTRSALALAEGLAPKGKHIVFDTERGRAKLFAGLHTFDEVDWQPPYDPQELARDILAAGSTHDVVIIDSLSHFWKGQGGTLDQVDAAKARRNNPNQFSAWQVGTKIQDELVEALLATPAHVIACMRSRMEYAEDVDANGRKTYRKVGMAAVQRDDLEYEFDVVGEIDLEHRISITKSRSSVLADKLVNKGVDNVTAMGVTLRKWLDEAAPEERAPRPTEAPGAAAPTPTTQQPPAASTVYQRALRAIEAMTTAQQTAFREGWAQVNGRKLTKSELGRLSAGQLEQLITDAEKFAQATQAELPVAP